MEQPRSGVGETTGSPIVRWVAPVDPVTGSADTRLCFLYADMWRRIVDPNTDDVEPLQGLEMAVCQDGITMTAVGTVGVRYGELVSSEVYDGVLWGVLDAVTRLNLRYETSDENDRRAKSVDRFTFECFPLCFLWVGLVMYSIDNIWK